MLEVKNDVCHRNLGLRNESLHMLPPLNVLNRNLKRCEDLIRVTLSCESGQVGRDNKIKHTVGKLVIELGSRDASLRV